MNVGSLYRIFTLKRPPKTHENCHFGGLYNGFTFKRPTPFKRKNVKIFPKHLEDHGKIFSGFTFKRTHFTFKCNGGALERKNTVLFFRDVHNSYPQSHIVLTKIYHNNLYIIEEECMQ
eukprot:TRINITY_DN3384_c0_g1_i4.p2 TRINITY_DN3384_c0_g1~~TRINITY_DN3384_c0_g1_i4.p2  ORF type:complete len:135 (-),score=5.85 TRINITY_DN3384_c0_g1_i4:346-699(-)